MQKQKTAAEPGIDIGADWVSFTVVRERAGQENVMIEDVLDFMDAHFSELEVGKDVFKRIARSPYKIALKLGVGGVVMMNETLSHFLVEIRGTGCRTLINRGVFDAVADKILYHAHNVTRFDLAVDIETKTDPEEFAALKSDKFSSHGMLVSGTGKTCYIGSPKSERRVRVYRYYEPHERAHLLRVEFVFKKPGAKPALEDYVMDKKEFAGAAGNTFGFVHPDWNLDSDGKIKVWRPERGKASTVRWVRNAVIPSLKRLFDEDIIDKEHPIWAELCEGLPIELTAENSGPKDGLE